LTAASDDEDVLLGQPHGHEARAMEQLLGAIIVREVSRRLSLPSMTSGAQRQILLMINEINIGHDTISIKQGKRLCIEGGSPISIAK